MQRANSTKNMHLIWEDQETGHALFLGDYYAATNVVKLRQSNISGVLTAAASLNIDHSQNEIVHKIINAWDIPSYNLGRHFDDAYIWMDEQLKQRNILVHCAAGISRSSTLVIMYLMKKNTWSLKRALTFVREKRSIVCPNYGFIKQLERFERAEKMGRNRLEQAKTNESFYRNSRNSRVESKENTTRNKEINDKSQNKGNIPDVRKWRVSSITRSKNKQEGIMDQIQSQRPLSLRKSSSIPKRTTLPVWKQFLKPSPSLVPALGLF